jgi:hypothetical protein
MKGANKDHADPNLAQVDDGEKSYQAVETFEDDERDFTNPGEGLECDSCNSKDYIGPGVLGLSDESPRPPKLVIPRLETLRFARPKGPSKQRNRTRCSAC